MNATDSTKVETFDCRQAFAETLIELATRIRASSRSATTASARATLWQFQKLFPERLINVGIAEQNMVGVSAGLANGGFIPFVCGAAPFLTGRALEQIKVDVAYNGFPDRSVRHESGNGLWRTWADPSLDRRPELAPRDRRARYCRAGRSRSDPSGACVGPRTASVPSYLRIGRTKVPSVTTDDSKAFTFGEASVLRQGSVAHDRRDRRSCRRALEAADALAERGIEARVINISTIKPLDEAAIIAAARETGAIVTAEEATTEGGLGAAVAEVVVRHAPVPMRILGVKGFAPTGSASYLLDHFGLKPGRHRRRRAGIEGQ